MKPAEEAIHLGLGDEHKSIKIAMEMTGENRYYFAHLHKTKPLVFRALIMGLVSQRKDNIESLVRALRRTQDSMIESLENNDICIAAKVINESLGE